MLRVRVMPLLQVQNRKLVKSTRFKNHQYIGDPVNAVKIYNEKEVDEIIVVDVSASIEKREPPFDLLRDITSECFMPLCYGGGIRSIDQMKKAFEMGVEKIALNSVIFEETAFIEKAASKFGSQSIVASLDIKKSLLGRYDLVTLNNTKRIKIKPEDAAVMVERMGAGEILLTSVDRDGSWDGYDLDLIKSVTDAVNIPVIACGGAGATKHFFDAVRDGNASAVAAGSMAVYSGKGMGVLVRFPSAESLKGL